MIKIATHKTFKYGTISLGLWIPSVFVKDNELQAKDDLDIYRTEFNGEDALIIIPTKSNGNSKPNTSLKSQENKR